ncbi:MAG: TlpA disulfide reductase family protein [Planctomycetota bacterium]
MGFALAGLATLIDVSAQTPPPVKEKVKERVAEKVEETVEQQKKELPPRLGAPVPAPREPRAQDPLVRELTEVLRVSAGAADAHVAAPGLGRFLDKYRDRDLAGVGYAPALYQFLNGDYETAVRDLEAYFARYAKLPVPAHATLVGRVYLDAIEEEGARASPDPVRVQGWAMRALDLQQPATAVGSRVQTALVHCGVGVDVASVRLALVRRLLDDRTLSEPERDRAVRALYGATVAETTAAATTEAPIAWRARALSGREIDLSALHGRCVLLHFWASWCPITSAEAPDLVATYQRFHTQGFEIVGIALDASDDDTVREAAKQLGFGWELVHDGGLDGPLAQRFGIEVLPHAILLDRDGSVCARGDAARGRQLAAHLERALARAPQVERRRD